MKNDRKKYEDIINLPNHRSKTRPHMSLHDRAAQFSPFAALSGHEAAIEETARLTETKAVLTEEEKARLNSRLLLLAKLLHERPEVSITYFLPDRHKEGGAYVTETSKVKKIDRFTNSIVMLNETIIPIEDIFSIKGAPFAKGEKQL